MSGGDFKRRLARMMVNDPDADDEKHLSKAK